MVAEDEIFNIWNIVSNKIIGDVWLTVFLAVAVIIFLSIRFKFPLEIQIMFIILILAAVFSQALLMIIWVFLVLLVGLIFYWNINKSVS